MYFINLIQLFFGSFILLLIYTFFLDLNFLFFQNPHNQIQKIIILFKLLQILIFLLSFNYFQISE
jgi:hypothetical protein